METACSRYEEATSQFIDIGAVGNAETGFKNLVIVCKEMEDVEAAREWCERAIEVAERADREEMRRNFRERLASLDDESDD